jgi:hypothetical protein
MPEGTVLLYCITFFNWYGVKARRELERQKTTPSPEYFSWGMRKLHGNGRNWDRLLEKL